jgi:hypothetical protein
MVITKLQLTKTNCRSTLKTVLCDLFTIDKHTWFQIIETEDIFAIQQVDEKILDTACVQASQLTANTGAKQLTVNIPRHLIKDRSFTLYPVVEWSIIDNKLRGTIKKVQQAGT